VNEYIPHILIFIGTGIIAFLSFLAIRAAKSTSWNTAPGVLLKKGTKLIVSKDQGRFSVDKNTVNWKSLHIDVEYAYQVDGVEYVSKRVTFCDMVNKPISSLDKILNEYLASDKVTVYYNPLKHSDSVLLPGVKLWNFTPMITGLIFIASGVFIFYYPG